MCKENQCPPYRVKLGGAKLCLAHRVRLPSVGSRAGTMPGPEQSLGMLSVPPILSVVQTRSHAERKC